MVSANPTGPVTVAAARNGAYGDAVARVLAFAGHEVEREYYYNDAGAQMERFTSVRRGGAAWRGAARGRLPGRLHRASSRSSTATRFRSCSSGSRRRSSASASTSTRGSGRARSSSRYPRRSRCSTRSRTTARCGRGRARTGTTRIVSSSAPAASRRTSRADAAYMRRKYARGFDRLDLRPRRRPSRLRRAAAGARRDARPPSRVARGARVPARQPRRGRGREEDVEASRRRRVPRRAHRHDRHRRGPLVPRLAGPRPDDRARRRPRQGTDEQESRLLRAVRARADRGHPAQRAGVRHGVRHRV